MSLVHIIFAASVQNHCRSRTGGRPAGSPGHCGGFGGGDGGAGEGGVGGVFGGIDAGGELGLEDPGEVVGVLGVGGEFPVNEEHVIPKG